MHVVDITRYVIRSKKHLHNQIEIIEIKRQKLKSSRIARNMNCYTPSMRNALVPSQGNFPCKILIDTIAETSVRQKIVEKSSEIR